MRKSYYVEMVSRAMSSPYGVFIATSLNIITLFIIWTLLRIEFLLENFSYFKPSIEEGRLLNLILAGPVFDTPGIMYVNALYVLMMLFPFHFKETGVYNRICKWVYMAINSVAVIMNVGDSVYFSYTMRRTTTEIFGEFGNESNFLKVFGAELIGHWYLVIFTILTIWVMWRLYVTPRYRYKDSSSLLPYYVVSVFALAVAALTVVSGIRGGLLNHWYNYILALPLAGMAVYGWRHRNEADKVAISLSIVAGIAAVVLFASAPIGGWRHRDIRPIALSNANAYTSHPVETALILNTPFTLIRTIGMAEFVDPHYFDDKEKLTEVYDPVVRPDSIAGHTKKNLVVIIVESFGREYIGRLSKEMLGEDYAGYTPFTDSLIDHSLAFRYSFCNGRKSIDGMPSVLTSIPMFVKPFVLTPQALNRLCGLPGHLSKIGYHTAFFHGARTGSMGFDGFARSIGFEKYYGREDYNHDPRFGGDKDFDGYWAIWDEPFLQFYAAKMSEMKQPFMTALFTASSHHPFNIPEAYKNKFPEEGLLIHKCIRYTDNALRQFFATASSQPWFKNTVFVITSDHTNMSDHDEYKTDIGGFCSPIIIYDPSGEIKPEFRNGIAQHIDIMPTLLNHVGYPYPYVAFGKDLLAEKESSLASDGLKGEDWAVNYLNGTYQYVRYGYILQFDGKKTTAIYSLDDHLMQRNLKGSIPEEEKMEKELKAIIQSYMDRMISDRLTETN